MHIVTSCFWSFCALGKVKGMVILMNWLEITVDAKNGGVEELCAILEEAGIGGLVIEDESDFESFLETNREYWDYVDEELRDEKRGISRVKFYVSDDMEGRALLEEAGKLLSQSDYSAAVVPVRDEDWENNWQKYYKPIEIGERLLVVPEWEQIPDLGDRAALRLNPGLIFGTGSHPTTQMCLKEIEKSARKGTKVLDLGCGSGILAIAALLLGCENATGCDIDPKAPDTAAANAMLNGIDGERFKVYAGDVLKDEAFRGIIGSKKYELVCANIVADVILALLPDVSKWLAPEGTFVCSGIIEGRQSEVEEAIKNSGLRIIEAHHEDDWYCFSACLACVAD